MIMMPKQAKHSTTRDRATCLVALGTICSDAMLCLSHKWKTSDVMLRPIVGARSPVRTALG